MKKLLKAAATRMAPRLALQYQAYKRLIANETSFLHSSGWMESLARGHPTRQDGSAIPWMNYAVIAFLEKRLRPEMSLFEYGSGYSTTFYARLVDSVVSVEYDRDWYAIISQQVPRNASILFRERDVDGAYCRAILAEPGRLFDVVVVDGRDRVNCVRQAAHALHPSGVVMLDDSSRDNYGPAFDHMRSLGFNALDFEGLKPTGVGTDRTTIFYRPGNCLKI